MENKNQISKDTICVHSGTHFDENTGGINSPIFTSSSYTYLNRSGNIYPRYFNTPNQVALIKKLKDLENTEDALIFGSGMAAITTSLFTFLKKGDHAVFQNGLYGGTQHYILKEFDKFSIEYSFTETTNISEFKKRIRANTKVIYIETPSNPLLSITSLKAVAELSRSNGIISMIDNTFASPINQNPSNHGIDVIIHSGTKYLGGHSDICCGAVAASKEIMDKIRITAYNFGGSLDANTCYLLERSLKTLALRVKKQSENAMQIAEYLQAHTDIKQVNYPGLKSHPGHKTANHQMSNYGGMLSFEVNPEKISINRFLSALQLITPALSLGGVDTIICVPAQTSHVKVSRDERLKQGISDELLRLSVGIEGINELIADIDLALEKAVR